LQIPTIVMHSFLLHDALPIYHALVIGATELDPIAIDGYVCGGWLPPHGRNGFVPSEGAAALLLRRAGTNDELRITQLADGFTHRDRTSTPLNSSHVRFSYAAF